MKDKSEALIDAHGVSPDATATKRPPPGWGCRRGPLSWALLCELRLIAEVCARRHDHRGNLSTAPHQSPPDARRVLTKR